jgi:hypothetical protein
LDLDTITWDRQDIQRRLSSEASKTKLDEFIRAHPKGWIIEGCYGELIEASLSSRPHLIFLDPGESICRERCQNRGWEPHKYKSIEEQNKFLEFLLSWVSDYYKRDGFMSHAFHKQLFESYSGAKTMGSNLSLNAVARPD